MNADDFVKSLKILPARRLEKSMKATVQASGRLVFATDAIKEMALAEDKSIKIYATSTNDLGAVLSEKDDPDAFTLKHNGPYFYVSFKNFLQESGIDFKKKKIVYDITNLGERFEGKTLYRFAYRELPNGSMNTEADEQEQEEQEKQGKPGQEKAQEQEVANASSPEQTSETSENENEETSMTANTAETVAPESTTSEWGDDDMPF